MQRRGVSHTQRAAACLVTVALGVALAACGHQADRGTAPEAPVAVSPATAGCDRFAAPSGSERAPGTRRRPVRSVKRLTRLLRAGQTGCLAEGRYRHRGVAELDSPRTILRPLRGARAEVDGTIWINSGARGARLSGIRLTTSDPTFNIPLKVQADDAKVTGNAITSSGNNTCVLIGSARTVRRVLIERNQISRCGERGKLDHLIYVAHTRNLVVRRNRLTANGGGWAVHLYPDADGTLVERNDIAGNLGGVIFGGDGRGHTSDLNVVRGNSIVGSGARWNLESSWSGGPAGARNVARDNCVHTGGAGAPSGIGPSAGLTLARNRVVPTPSLLQLLFGARPLDPGAECSRLGYGR